MPFTPFHFGPHACVGLAFHKRIDVPVFILANVIVDVEPLLVMVFGFLYPLHGYAHTFIGAAFIGGLWGSVAFWKRSYIDQLMRFFGFSYNTSFLKCLISGALGGVFHVLLDAPLYYDIKPFFPLSDNPLFGLVLGSSVYLFCMLCILPAIWLFMLLKKRQKINIPNNSE